MFGIALDLKPADFLRLLKEPKASITGLVSQFILLPAVTFLLILLFRPQYSMALGMILVAACPGGNVSNFISHTAKANTALSVTLTAFSTVLAIVMTPFNFSFWSSLLPYKEQVTQNISLNPLSMLETITMIILIPLVLGMLANHYAEKVVAKVKKPISIISMFIFLGFLVIAFSNNANIFIEYFNKVMGIVFVHNASALAIGYFLALLVGLPLRDRKTVSIETGIQNSALGLVLIFNFFNGLGGMALIAAWWGIWHIISGFTLAAIWRRRT